MCLFQIVAFKPDIVITEKGVSDLAQHYFLKAGITAFRRLRKTDQNRVARATGKPPNARLAGADLCRALDRCAINACVVLSYLPVKHAYSNSLVLKQHRRA